MISFTYTYHLKWHNLTQVHAELDSSSLTACEQEELMRQIFYPKSGYELQVSIYFGCFVERIFLLQKPIFEISIWSKKNLLDG